jgi:hypothetical protein
LRFALGNGHNFLAGTAKQIADYLEEWFMNEGADGFTFILPYAPDPLERFVDLVVPELQRRGLFRLEYEGTTLRENLGLAHPENRYTANRRLRAAAGV